MDILIHLTMNTFGVAQLVYTKAMRTLFFPPPKQPQPPSHCARRTMLVLLATYQRRHPTPRYLSARMCRQHCLLPPTAHLPTQQPHSWSEPSAKHVKQVYNTVIHIRGIYAMQRTCCHDVACTDHMQLKDATICAVVSTHVLWGA